jgi:hypothetical protein
MPSFHACSIWAVISRQRVSFFDTSIISRPTATAESHSCSTIAAYSRGEMLRRDLKNVSSNLPGAQALRPSTDKPGGFVA